MNKLIKRAKKAGRALRFVPFLRLAALNGSIVRGEETKESDIDILIIAKAGPKRAPFGGRLYTARFFATCLIALTGYRRHGNKVAGRICLNCYLCDKNPSILPEDKRNMSKVANAYKYMIPLVDDGISRKFFKINKWFDNYNVKGESHSQLLKSHCFKNFPLQGSNPSKPSACHCAILRFCHCEYSKQSVLYNQDRHASKLAMTRGRIPATTSCHPDRVLESRDLWRMPATLFETLLSGKLGDFIEHKLMSYQIKRILKNKQSGDQIYADQFAIKLHPRKP